MSPSHLIKSFKPFLLFLASLLLVFACSSKDPMPNTSTSFPQLTQVPESAWNELAQKKILFGHASVGYNIADGLKDLTQENPKIKLSVIENDHPWEVKTPGFIHFHLVKEGMPASKITFAKVDTFKKVIQTKVLGQADIAFFKFCWADITPYSDVTKIFSYYKDSLSELAKAFPKTTFVQTTVPLAHENGGFNRVIRDAKDGIRGLVGMSLPDIYDNKKINELNDLIRKEYTGKATFFDLAQVESTFPDGKRQQFSSNGKNYFSLVSDYTSDMGHLNKTGRKVVAEQLLIFLTKLAA